jgi:hypothetical protein
MKRLIRDELLPAERARRPVPPDAGAAGRVRRPLARRDRRRGIATLVTMLYVVLFAALAVGFYVATTIASQISRNERQLADAQFATESGVRFIRYQLASILIPAATKTEDVFPIVYTELSKRLDGTGNLNGGGIGYGLNIIAVPAGGNWVKLNDEGAGFKATIVPKGQLLRVKVTGRSSDGARPSSRAVQMDFAIAMNASKIFDYGVASRSSIHLNSNAMIRGATNDTLGNVMTTSSAVPSLIMDGSAQVSGDVTFTNQLPGRLVMSSAATISDYTSTDPKLPEHIHYEAKEPDFPVIDTTAFEPFATNRLTEVAKKYEFNTLRNIRIAAGTNPTFDAGMTIEGIVYIETPNQVTFGANSAIRGAIVVQNNPSGDTGTNTITFNTNSTLYPMETLPATADFPPGLRSLTGAMILAPSFKVVFNSNFGSVGGTVIADQFLFNSNARGSITGSLIGMTDKPMVLDSNSDVSILSRGTTAYPAGVFFGSHFAALSDTYKEVQP